MFQNGYMYQGFNQAYPQPYQDRLAQLQSQYQQTMPQNTPQPMQNGSQGILWVQGEAGAKAYMMAPNTTILLMDSEGQRFYLKSTDMSGVPTLRTFKYTEVTAQTMPEEVPGNKYVTRQEYDEIKGKVDGIIQSIDNLKPRNSRSKAEVSTDE